MEVRSEIQAPVTFILGNGPLLYIVETRRTKCQSGHFPESSNP